MLSKKNRLTKRGSFAYVYKKGKAVSDKNLKLFCVKSSGVKIGFSVSNKIGKATVRNKVKRRLRAAFRQYVDKIHSVQMVVLAKKEVVNADFAEILLSTKSLLKKLSIL